MEIGAVLGAEAGADGLEVFTDEDAWDVIEDIPNDSAAALILIEHHWAVGLRNAVANAGGVRISDGFIDPIDLVAVGLVAEAEAEEHAALSNAISLAGSHTDQRKGLAPRVPSRSEITRVTPARPA